MTHTRYLFSKTAIWYKKLADCSLQFPVDPGCGAGRLRWPTKNARAEIAADNPDGWTHSHDVRLSLPNLRTKMGPRYAVGLHAGARQFMAVSTLVSRGRPRSVA